MTNKVFLKNIILDQGPLSNTKIMNSLKECTEMLSKLDCKDVGSVTKILSDTLPFLDGSESGSKGKASSTKKNQKVIALYAKSLVSILEEASSHSLTLISPSIKATRQALDANIFKEFPLLRKRILVILVSVWSGWPEDSVRIIAILAIHSLLRKNSSLATTASKLMYKHYLSSCKSLSTHNLGQATLMLNGLVEVFSMYPGKMIEGCLSHLRQLAAILQTAMKKAEPENIRKVICWSFISAVRFWSQLLCQTCGTDVADKNSSQSHANSSKNSNNIAGSPSSSPFNALLFPVCNILSALLSFQVSPRFYPFHFHVCSAIFHLMSSLGSLDIPSAPSLLLKIIFSVLKQPLYKLEIKKASYDLPSLIKVPKSETMTKGYLVSVLDDAIFLLTKYMATLCKVMPLTFPEACVPATTAIKGFLKKNKSPIDKHAKSQIIACISSLTQQQISIQKWRNAKGLTPLSCSAGGKNGKIALQDDEDLKKALVLGTYLERLDQVRLIKRKLLADKQSSPDQDLEKNEKIQSNKDLKALASKRNAAEMLADAKQPKKSKKTISKTSSKPHPDATTAINDTENENDILEEFII